MTDDLVLSPHGGVLAGCCLYVTCEEPTAVYIIHRNGSFFHLHSRCANHAETKPELFGTVDKKIINPDTYTKFQGLSTVSQKIVLQAWFPTWQPGLLLSDEDPEVGF